MKSKLAEIYCLIRISSLNEHDPICTQSYLRVCRNLPEGTFSKVLQWQTAMQTVRRREGFLTFARWVQQCSPVGLSEV